MTDTLAIIGRFSLFAGRVLRRALRPPLFLSEVFRHTWTTSIRCMVPVTAVMIPFGMVIALQGLAIFSMFGAERMLASLISVTILRELSPVLASVLVAAQGGSACAAELGAMRIKEELDATEVMAVDSLKIHVIPRIIALTGSCCLLNVVGSVAGIVGAYITAVWIKGQTGGVFLAELWALTQPLDVWSGTVKTLVFGAIIGLVASHHGFHASGGAAGVGRAVNQTVVHGVVGFIVVNYFLTSALYGGTL
ncbi:MAG: ABC transporter permease [Myxococcota bacterium]|jgi:phospholipid/cholesterol/gamma-HCH transport system permease protein|nr:ABC transporter permease [Myxococcota bacterium]